MKIKKLGILCVFATLFSLIPLKAQTTTSNLDSLSDNNLLAYLQLGTGLEAEGQLFHNTLPIVVTFDPYVNYYRWIITDPLFASVTPPIAIAEPQDSLATIEITVPLQWATPYTFEIIVMAQDGSINTYYINAINGVGQEEFDQDVLSIYPNPSTGTVNVEVTEDVKDYTIDVVSVAGQKVFSSKYENTNTQVTLSLLDIADGIYYIILKDIQSGKFSKEKISILK